MPKHCAGASGVACSFGVPGGAKQVGGNYSQCMWCNPERMLAACRDTTQGRHNVVKAFKQMTAEQQVRALRRVPQDYQAAFQTLAARSDRCVGLAGEPCCFQESIVGGVAKARQGSNQCVWCDKAALAEACRLESGRKKLLPHLRRLTLAARQKAMNERVPEQHKQFFLDAVYRCKDPKFNNVLQELRTSRPSKKTLKWLQQHKAWTPPGKPTRQGLQSLFKTHPKTVVLTCTRKGAFTVNEMALKALFPRHAALVTVKADVESNPENYDQVGNLVEASLRKPADLPIFKGAKVCFTRNVRKDIDFVNGMDAVVIAYHPRSKAVEVLTETGHRVMVWPWSDMDADGLTYYPLKGGYADTILKYQGAELDHVTVFLDAEGVPGAAYTALTRVSYAKDFLIGGVVKGSHFQPVDETGPAR
eukprot:s3477_g2.t1